MYAYPDSMHLLGCAGVRCRAGMRITHLGQCLACECDVLGWFASASLGRQDWSGGDLDLECEYGLRKTSMHWFTCTRRQHKRRIALVRIDIDMVCASAVCE